MLIEWMNLFNGSHVYIKIISTKRHVAGALIVQKKNKIVDKVGTVLLPIDLIYEVIDRNGGLFSFEFSTTDGTKYHLKEGKRLLVFDNYDGSLDQVTLTYVDDSNAKYLIPSYSSKQNIKEMICESLKESVISLNYFPMRLETPYHLLRFLSNEDHVTISIYGYLISVRKKFLNL